MKNLEKRHFTTSALRFISFLFTLLFFPILVSYGQTEPPSFKVEVFGKGQPMILIPGLSCSGEVWEETVAHYKNDYQCHVLTLAGFADQPPIEEEHFLETVTMDLAAYIRQQEMEKVVLVGHSLGGFLGMWLSSKEPDLVTALIIVDSAPFLPALIYPDISAEGAKNRAISARDHMKNLTKEQVRQSQPQVLRSMISDEDKVALALEWNVESHIPTSSQAMYELYTTDLREEIAEIVAPTLVIAAWIAYKDYGVTHDSTKKNYQNQLSELSNYELVINDKAKHFIMWDDPEGFYSTMDDFLARKGL